MKCVSGHGMPEDRPRSSRRRCESVISLSQIHSHFPSIRFHLSVGIRKRQPLRTLIQASATVCSVTELILFFLPPFSFWANESVRRLIFLHPVTVRPIKSPRYAALRTTHTLIGFGFNDDRDYTAYSALTFGFWVVSQTGLTHLSCGHLTPIRN